MVSCMVVGGGGDGGGGKAVKVAATVTALFEAMTHWPVPVQPPPFHPANVEPLAAVADSVTTVPEG
jgi:hypothetical protein